MKNRAIIKKTGTLRFEVCDFDVHKVYGTIGKAFAECHHTFPLYHIEAGAKIKLSDQAKITSASIISAINNDAWTAV